MAQYDKLIGDRLELKVVYATSAEDLHSAANLELLPLIGEKAMGPDGIGFVFAGAGFMLYSPINGMFKALDNWKVPIVKEFEINDSSWKIDLDSMLSNNKSVEQN